MNTQLDEAALAEAYKAYCKTNDLEVTPPLGKPMTAWVPGIKEAVEAYQTALSSRPREAAPEVVLNRKGYETLSHIIELCCKPETEFKGGFIQKIAKIQVLAENALKSTSDTPQPQMAGDVAIDRIIDAAQKVVQWVEPRDFSANDYIDELRASLLALPADATPQPQMAGDVVALRLPEIKELLEEAAQDAEQHEPDVGIRRDTVLADALREVSRRLATLPASREVSERSLIEKLEKLSAERQHATLTERKTGNGE